MKVTFAALADAATIGEGKFNLLGVFWNIMGPEAPMLARPFTAAISVEFEEPEMGIEQGITAIVVNRHGNIIWKTPETIHVRIDRKPEATPEQIKELGLGTLQLLCAITNVKIPAFGKYSVRILMNGKMIHELPLTAMKVNLIGETNDKVDT